LPDLTDCRPIFVKSHFVSPLFEFDDHNLVTNKNTTVFVLCLYKKTKSIEPHFKLSRCVNACPPLEGCLPRRERFVLLLGFELGL